MIIREETVIGGSSCYSTEYVVRAWCHKRTGEYNTEEFIFERTFSYQYTKEELICGISVCATKVWYEMFTEDLDIRRIDIIEMTP